MVPVTTELALPADSSLTLYHATDACLAHLPILIFHGPSTTTNSTQNSSRIQAHIVSAAGAHSYPRITVSPNSPLYAAVNHLPRDKQGDEIYRGLAFALLKYFRELPEAAKSTLIVQSAAQTAGAVRGRRTGPVPTLFGEQHAAEVATALLRVDNAQQVVEDLGAALRAQHIEHVDVDLVLPPGSIAPFEACLPEDLDILHEDEPLPDPALRQYGGYAALVKLFGDRGFLPTSKLRRAPSRPTSLNRSKSFHKDKKVALRRAMTEMIETEERYVAKLQELVGSIATDFRSRARDRHTNSQSPSLQDLDRLFPPSLDKILEINAAFLEVGRRTLSDSEADAVHDFEASQAPTSSRSITAPRIKDPTGAADLAKVLLEWFPQFETAYQQYMHASQDFPQIISSFMRQPTSFSQRVQQTGEQKLRSAVIEPVQRLPRYSLFLDNIINQLPFTHPALQPMLKAKDIITQICSLETPTDQSQVVQRLRHLVDTWPNSFHPRGRLITAIDFVELVPPYHIHASTLSDPLHEGMLLLFADCIIILRKVEGCTLSARGLVAEVDKPSAVTMMAPVQAAAGGQRYVYSLGFSGWHALSDTRFTVSDDGNCLWMTSLHELQDSTAGRDRSQLATTRQFYLQTTYEGKASKATEEITKARIEGRFSETERETETWSFRQLRDASRLSLHTAVFAEGVATLVQGRKEPCPIRIVVDHHLGTKGAPVGHYGVEILANIKTIREGVRYRLEVAGLDNQASVDEVMLEHVLPVLAKRLADILQAQHSTSNANLASSLISYYSKILRCLHISTEAEKKSGFRPTSPVKMLSSFLNSGFGSSSTQNHTGSFNSRHLKSSQLGPAPLIGLPLSRSNSNKSTHSVYATDSKSSRAVNTETRPVNALFRLEETFTAYIAALQSRKGNILGRTLRNRTLADELAVNALYNAFIEKPFDTRATLDATVDVIFVAFEKFLRLGWQEQMGQVLPLQTLNALQEHALRMAPRDFTDYIRMNLNEMAPQNRRAFIAVIKLLADLLDGCGNDGDRGEITASFAELLVIDGHPHQYIILLDRIVAESDCLFDDIGPGATVSYGETNSGSVSSRLNVSNTGSLTSNASSLRRRFDTLLRQNSTKDSDRPSVWRTLSKSGRNNATGDPASLSKATLKRSQSIESRDRRPLSQGRLGALSSMDDRPSSSAGLGNRLSVINASPPPADEKRESERERRKKRRSSLSDLKAMLNAATLAGSPPMTPNFAGTPLKGTDLPVLPALKFNTTPRTPSPTRIPISRDRNSSLILPSSPRPKENTPLGTSRNTGNLTERTPNTLTNNTPDAMVVKPLWSPRSHAKTISLTSNIPLLKSANPNTSRPTTSAGKASSPQKLRLNSPQKIRERVQNEARAITEAETSLQAELAIISAELSRVTSTSSPSRHQRVKSAYSNAAQFDASRIATASTSDTCTPEDLARLRTSVAALEARLPSTIAALQTQHAAIAADLEHGLQAAEYKTQALDQLHREASAENELLYERLNAELAKLVKALRGKGPGDKEELLRLVREATEREAGMRKELGRARREVVGLKAALRAGGREV